MKHILVPVGASENCISTLQYAVDLAEKISAKVLVFRAYKMISKTGTMINVDKIVERESNLYLRTIIAAVDQKDVSIQMITAKGHVLDAIQAVHADLGLDLIVMGPRSNSIKDEVFLGKTSGSIVKYADIPVLIVPEGYGFKPVKSVLVAFKSGLIKKDGVLSPLKHLATSFDSLVHLLLVKTPGYNEEDLVVAPELEALQTSYVQTENATTFQGVLEHFQSHQPDMLCVFRRKRGFFNKLWEKNTVLKKEFHCSVPLLVLRGQH